MGRRAFDRARLATAISDRLAEAHRAVRAVGLSFLGRAGVLATSFVSRARSYEQRRGMVPTVAAADPVVRRELLRARRSFLGAYFDALRKWRDGVRQASLRFGTWWMRVHHGARIGLAMAWPCSLYLSQFVMHRLLTEWARGAVAAARFRRSAAPSDRRSVAKSVRAIRRIDEPWARGLASALESASVRQTNEAGAIALLERAHRELTTAGMGLFADAAAHERARLRGDDQARAAARAQLERRGVLDAEKLAQTLVPGM